MSASLLALPATALYFVSGLLIGLRLFGPAEARKPPRGLGIGLGVLAAALHAVLIWTQTLTETGLNVAFFSVTSLIAWVIAVLVLASSFNKPVENLGIVLLSVVAFAAVDAFAARRIRAPEARRVLPASLPLGVAHDVVLRLANEGGSAVTCEVHDHHPPGVEPKGLPHRVTVPARGWAEIRYSVRPVKRGPIAFGLLELRLAGLTEDTFSDRFDRMQLQRRIDDLDRQIRRELY